MSCEFAKLFCVFRSTARCQLLTHVLYRKHFVSTSCNLVCVSVVRIVLPHRGAVVTSSSMQRMRRVRSPELSSFPPHTGLCLRRAFNYSLPAVDQVVVHLSLVCHVESGPGACYWCNLVCCLCATRPANIPARAYVCTYGSERGAVKITRNAWHISGGHVCLFVSCYMRLHNLER